MRWLYHRFVMFMTAWNMTNELTERVPEAAGLRNFGWQLKYCLAMYKWYVYWYTFCRTHTQEEIYREEYALEKALDALLEGKN